MITIRNEEKGAVLKCTDEGETHYIYVSDLMARIWDEYIREMIDKKYVCGLLKDLQFSDAEIERMIERLEAGKKEYDTRDYREVSYI